MPHFAEPNTHEEILPLASQTDDTDTDEDNVFFVNQVVARPKETRATRERLVEVEFAAEEARLHAQRAAADLYEAAAQVELARAPLAEAVAIQKDAEDELEACARRLSHAQVENERIVKSTNTNSSSAWDARKDEADALKATEAKLAAGERMRAASDAVKKAEAFVNEATANVERRRVRMDIAIQAAFNAIDTANGLAASMDAVDAALMESDERHKDAVRMVRLFYFYFTLFYFSCGQLV